MTEQKLNAPAVENEDPVKPTGTAKPGHAAPDEGPGSSIKDRVEHAMDAVKERFSGSDKK